MENMWQACTPFVSLFKGCIYKNTQSGDCHMAGKTYNQRSEVVMESAGHYFHKHTRGTWLSACDHFGHTNWQDWHPSCSLCVISGLLYTVKVKLKNKWIYWTHKRHKLSGLCAFCSRTSDFWRILVQGVTQYLSMRLFINDLDFWHSV